MKSPRQILKAILKEIKPTKKEERELNSFAQKVLKIAKSIAKKYNAEPMLVGSLTRGTWLPDKKEFDVFILFPETVTPNELERKGLLIGKKIVERLKGTYVVEYAQHPYVSADFKGIKVDIVPCYKIRDTNKLLSAVDRTPFHVQWLKKHLKKKQGDEVRLLKKFLKVHGIYGADAKTLGFSGYATELLIVVYRDFINVLKAAIKWKPGEIIDPEGYYKEKDYKFLRKKFKNQPLILIDPTDKNRNVTSALSVENFFKFKKYAKEFLNNPSKETFYGKQKRPLTDIEFSQLRFRRGTEIIMIKFKPPKVVPDILWPQLRKFAERIKNILEERKYEFKVYGTSVYTDEKDIALVLLEMEVSRLPYVQKIVGPPVFDEVNSKRFIESHKSNVSGPYIEGIRWVVEVKRKFKNAKEKIIDSLSKPKDILKKKGIPNFIAEEISKGFEILDPKEIEKLLKEKPEVGIFLRDYFQREKLI